MLLLAFSACKKDDDDVTTVCMQDDWVGTYSGTVDCDGTEEAVTVTITASGTDNIIIKYESASTTTEYDPLPFNGCDLNVSGTVSGITVNADVTLNGDQLDMSETISIGGNTTTCTIAATRN